MRTRFTSLALWSDRRGNVAMMFGLTLPILAATMAAAVDLSTIYGAERNLQQSADTAALAAAKEYAQSEDPGFLAKVAEGYFFHNAGEDSRGYTQFSYDGVQLVGGDRVLKVSATRQQPTWFGDLLAFVTNEKVDWRNFPIASTSEVVLENLSIEMALVLDNSGSMGSSVGGAKKIDTLKSAAKDLTAALMKVNATAFGKPPVMMGVVPFSGSVNVGPANINAPWMDRFGESPIHHENFDWASWTEAKNGKSGAPLAEKVGLQWRRKSDGQVLTRQWLFENARELVKEKGKYVPGPKRFPEGWEGCVESRPEGLAVTDDAPLTGASLFVPMFAPDEYDWWGFTGWKNDYLADDSDGKSAGAAQSVAWQSDMNKYLESTAPTRGGGSGRGPNLGCSTTPITPLSADQSTVDAALDKMQPTEMTNIPEGIAWGWRVLSPGAPFTEGRAKDAKDNLKVLVVMTDGENTYGGASNANRSRWGAYGYGEVWSSGSPQPGRMFDATTRTIKKADDSRYVEAMNEMTEKVCANAKNDGRRPDGTDGILIFTIAFDVKDGSKVKTLLEGCASYGLKDPTTKLYYDAQNKEQLVAAFGAITDEVSSLRLSR
ncbi:MAG TPA: pilus assembly protein [Aurantimonas coralicida]|uniref:Pilus assembly protein n=2 Tax=root TaxID=1 RepID=A0A9C9NG78_9HYPH|nr:pilus assembly protein [Aurantimonas coralicida]HEU00760.1 pilus assembly protein [Aurantimonas coralicida]